MIKGVLGHIKWHYQIAAEIRGYTVSRSLDKRWSLRATVVSADAYKLDQRPLAFVAPIKNRVWDAASSQWVEGDEGEWRWPVESLQVDGSTVVAQLGAPS